MSSNQVAIEFHNVWKKYSRGRIFHRSLREDLCNLFSPPTNTLSNDEFWALKNIDFSICAGETVGFYGPNGAGKSTILKLIANITYPTQGAITVKGKVAPLIELRAGFHPDLTGRENIFVNAAILGMTIPEIKQKMESMIDFAEVREFIDMPVKKYSTGMYLRLAFSVAIHSQADIYLFDEIIAVGDEGFQKKCLQKITELKENNKTILLVSHNKSLLQRLTSRIFLVENGGISISNCHQEGE